VAIYAIGDVQGCHDALQRLLDAVRFDPAADRLWFCGDLVNRGGQSLETLRLVHSLDRHSVVVLGNHDLSLLSIAARKEGEQRKVNPDLQRVLFADDRDLLLDWLRQRPLLHVDRELGWTMVHAGLAPKWTVKLAEARAVEVERVLRGRNHDKLFRGMYGDRPNWTPKLKGTERLRAIINVFTRMRYCNAAGTIAYEQKGAPGSQRAGLYPWFEVPGHAERETRVVCGHWSTLGLFMGLGVHGIDTGCVWGGRLTALELSPIGEPPRVIQVPGRSVEDAISQ
jgi:bis(5'-nucleosyl)-tetraphosphatase (symmetrical)